MNVAILDYSTGKCILCKVDGMDSSTPIPVVNKKLHEMGFKESQIDWMEVGEVEFNDFDGNVSLSVHSL